jgi:hypothetical protein
MIASSSMHHKITPSSAWRWRQNANRRKSPSCRRAALPHCGPSRALSMTEPSRRLAAASGLRRPSVTCSPGSEREVNRIARPVPFRRHCRCVPSSADLRRPRGDGPRRACLNRSRRCAARAACVRALRLARSRSRRVLFDPPPGVGPLFCRSNFSNSAKAILACRNTASIASGCAPSLDA